MTSPGRIARALAIFSVDEVVVYNDLPTTASASQDGQTSTQANNTRRKPKYHHDNDAESSFTAEVDPCHFLTHLLSYLECPPFMRKALFPIHPNLRLAGMLPSLDMPHHPNPRDAALPYREGVTAEGTTSSGRGTLVEIGAKAPVEVADDIPPNTRLTLHLPHGERGVAEAVHPAAPREEGGYYWGYGVRSASSLSAVFEESPHEGGYDVSIGTSEHGQSAAEAFSDYQKTLKFKHLLIVFGGPRGIEYAAANDAKLANFGISGAGTKELFDHWVNILPMQGSRNIRTDEAVFIALAGMRRLWDSS